MKKYRVAWRSPGCGFYGHHGIVEVSSEEEIPELLAKICSCKVADIDLGPFYEIKPLDATAKSKELSRKEIEETIALIQKHNDIREYGVVINRRRRQVTLSTL